MKISCQACSTKYSIPDEKVQGEGRTFKIRCKNCGEMMTVKGIGESEAAGAADDQWYYAVGSDRKGPVTSADVAGLVAAGTINADTYVWQQGMEAWTHLKDVGPLAGALGGGAAAPAEEPEADTAYMSKDAIMAAHQDYTEGAGEDPDGATVAMDKPEESLFAAAEASAASSGFGEALSTAGSEDTSSNPFGGDDSDASASGGSDDMFSFDNVEDASDESPSGVHGRRDSSVLFSLDELANPDDRAGMSQEEAILTETSGLIDIRAVANREKSTGGDDPFGASGTGGLAVPGAGGGFAPVSVPIVAPKKGKSGSIIAIAAVLLLLVGGGVGFFMWQSAKADAEKAAAATEAAEKVAAAERAAKKAAEEKAATEKAAAAKIAAAEKLAVEKTAAAKIAKAELAAGAKVAAAQAAAAAAPAPTPATAPAAGTAPVATPTPSSGGAAKKKKKRPSTPSSAGTASAPAKPKPAAKPKPTSKPANTKKANDLLSALNKPKPKSGGGDSGASGTGPARLSSAQVRSSLNGKKSKFRSCLKLMATPPAGSVTVRTKIVIKGSGRVSSAKVTSSGGTSGSVQSCVIRAIKGIKFGSFRDASMTVNYPVRLQ